MKNIRRNLRGCLFLLRHSHLAKLTFLVIVLFLLAIVLFISGLYLFGFFSIVLSGIAFFFWTFYLRDELLIHELKKNGGSVEYQYLLEKVGKDQIDKVQQKDILKIENNRVYLVDKSIFCMFDKLPSSEF